MYIGYYRTEKMMEKTLLKNSIKELEKEFYGNSGPELYIHRHTYTHIPYTQTYTHIHTQIYVQINKQINIYIFLLPKFIFEIYISVTDAIVAYIPRFQSRIIYVNYERSDWEKNT